MNFEQTYHYLKKCPRPYVALLIGPPLSGKDTFLNFLKSKGLNDFKIISNDDILFEVSREKNYMKNTVLNLLNNKSFKPITKNDDFIFKFTKESYNYVYSNVSEKELKRVVVERKNKYSANHKNVIFNMTQVRRKRRNANLTPFLRKTQNKKNYIYHRVAIQFPLLDLHEYFTRNIRRTNNEQKYIKFKHILSMVNSYQDLLPERYDKIIKLKP